MMNVFTQTMMRLRRTKFRWLSTVALTALVLTVALSRADPDKDHPEESGLPGTWMSDAEPGVPPSLFSFISDGRLIFSRAIVTPTGPVSFDLVGTGHGEWIQTGKDEFASTMFLIRSGPTVEFTGLVKVTSTFKLNRKTDQLISAGTVYISFADPQIPPFSFPSPGSGVLHRVTVGQ